MSTPSKPVYAPTTWNGDADTNAIPLIDTSHSDSMMNKLSEDTLNDVQHTPNLSSRLGEDENDARVRPLPDRPNFPPVYDMEGAIPDYESIPDINVYQHKKTLAQGMMDLALFSANANQLRYVLESYDRHPYYWPSMLLISLSLILQILIGIGLILNSRYNVKDEKEICIANKISNYTIVGIFIVTSVNVFISAFGVANAPSTTPPPSP